MNSTTTGCSAIAVFLFFIFVHSASCTENPFFIADDMDAAPYIFADATQKPDGIFHDIISSAFKRMNVPFKHEVYPWKRAQMIVKSGQADALITIPTPSRLEYLRPSREPVFTMKYKIFTQQDNPNIEQIKSVTSLSQLKGLKIIDYIGDGWAEKNLTQYGVEWSPNLTSACKMIAAHRGDVFLQDETMVLYTIKNIEKYDKSTNYKNIVSFDAPVSQVGFHLLIRNDSPYKTLLLQFDRTIRSMRDDGELDKIKEKWIN